MIPLILGLAAAQMTISSTLSAWAETQAAIDAVTLAHSDMPSPVPIADPIETKIALAR
jgi:hypothetical protein